MADFDASEALKAAGNPFKVTDPEKIPAKRFYDEDYFRLESEGVWGHCWQMAARLETIPNPGDWVEYTILDKSVLVVNTKNGVKALCAVAKSHPVEALQFLFPNHFLLIYFSCMTSYRVRPLTAETCLFEIWSLTHMAPGTDTPVPLEPVILPYDSKDFPQIPQQDYSNIPIQQKGMHSQGFEFMRLSKDREGLISNNHRVIDALIEGKPLAKVAKASGQLACNFDGAILDLDL